MDFLEFGWNLPRSTVHTLDSSTDSNSLMCVMESCRETDNSSDSHVNEHWLMISDDLVHDFEFVHHTIKKEIVPELASIH